MVKMVSKQGLEDLEINLPSLEQQAKIADFSASQCESSSS